MLRSKIKVLEVDDLDYGNRYTTQPNKVPACKKKRNLSQNFTPKNNKMKRNFYSGSEDSTSVRYLISCKYFIFLTIFPFICFLIFFHN